MAFTLLFLKDDCGECTSPVAAHFPVLPRVGSVLRYPGRPPIRIEAVRPALPPREQGEHGIPAHVYAVVVVAVESSPGSVEVEAIEAVAYAA